MRGDRKREKDAKEKMKQRRTDTRPEQQGGLKQRQQQRWTEATSTAKVDRSDVNSKGELKRYYQHRWAEGTSTAKVGRRYVSSKCGPKLRQQQRWAEATSTAKMG
ncbi:hypothetical protein ElyMa_005022400 [Elysia marginata]|uniref:Uncharacterized protein n=1 Tax=Elysia marginata TaxID=1093978 RepID=A0AAV4JC62_9GAST|nr:hypothetical protein ElyMa_005022400 [Elysia marginata]